LVDYIDVMSDRSKRRDGWVAATGLVAAFAALPLPSHAHSAELASVLAVGAIAALAGFRWGLAVVVAAEVFLVAAVWPLAILARPPSLAAQIAVTVACLGAVPGMARMLGGADELIELLGVNPGRWRRPAARGLVAASAILLAWPAVA